MELQLIKKYIAAYLSTTTTRLETVEAPMPGIKVDINGNESFFYPSANDENTFFEEYGDHIYIHVYNTETKAFTTTEK
ncbi:hypothetical protein [Pediococcus pentosaceus]|uniref:hypothetical protein n=1 Tax=Pediococcus pentosaceus TaxID=1255 RepID=UPI00200E3BAA|nr:hypothetical protein [Pediococcus pentosaceus]UQB00776.1 hypothetical protein Ped0941_00215 [Pediococcus pentosaceus]UQB02624.1 hypothetical protein Ped0620_00215 [Pediococcus pentosaceus]